jgi:hypothetical protein
MPASSLLLRAVCLLHHRRLVSNGFAQNRLEVVRRI